MSVKIIRFVLTALMACLLTADSSLSAPIRAQPRFSSNFGSTLPNGVSLILQRRFENDFASEPEFQNLLDELRRESEASSEPSIIEDPQNYINSEEGLQEFLRLSALEHQLAGDKPTGQDERAPSTEGASNKEPCDCSICLESLKEPTNALDPVDLKCGHSFHYACLKDWFASIRNSRQKSCPNCRKECSSLLLVEHVNERAARVIKQ